MQQNFDIRVISLIDQQDRRERVQQLFKDTNIAWQFLDAVSGKNLENYWHHYDQAQRLKTLGYDMRNNEIACFLSHRIAWQQCVENDRPMLVLEDDIQLTSRLKSFDQVIPMAEALIAFLKENLFVRIGNLHGDHPENKAHLEIHTFADQPSSIVRYKKDPMTTMGYLLSPQIAKKLLAHSEKFSLPVDNFLWCGWQHGACLLDILPPLVFTSDDDTPSTIGNRQKPEIKFFRKISREWHRLLHNKNQFIYRKFIAESIFK